MASLNGQVVGDPASAPPVGGGAANNEVPISNGAPGSGQFGDAQVPSPATMDANPHSDFVNNVLQTVTGMADTAKQVWDPVTGVDPSKIGGQVLGAAKQLNTLIQGGITAEPPIPATDYAAKPVVNNPNDPIIQHVNKTLEAYGSRVGGPPGMKYEKVDLKGQSDAAEAERKAIDEKAKVEMYALDVQSALKDEEVKRRLAHAEKMQNIANEADAATEARAKEKEATRQAILAQATTIDPDRWMHSRTPGQLFAMVLANGLTQGRAWSQFQAAIDNDVRAQQQSYENRSKQLKDADAVSDSIYGLYRQRGLDRNAAAIATDGTMSDIFKMRFEAAAATSNSAFVKANAAAAIAASQGREAKNKTADINEQNEFRLKQAQLAASNWKAQKEMELEREKFTLAAQMKNAGVGSPGDTQEMKGPQTEAIATQEYLAENAKTLYKLFPENTVGVDAMWNKVLALFPGTEGYKFNQKREAVLQNLRVAMEKGIVRKEDIPYYDGIFKKAYDIGGKNAWKEAMQSAESSLRKSLDAAADAGMGGTVAKMKERMSQPGKALAPIIDFEKE